MKIFLLGFMGSGKTFYGKKIAKQLKMDFVDLDERIIEAENKTISEIFHQKKEKGFRRIEQSALKSLDKLDNTVIACGGGTPCFFDNMKWMNKNGSTIYLKASTQLLFDRLKNGKQKRPLLEDLTDRDLKVFIKNKVAERSSFYEQANYIAYQRNGDSNYLKRLISISDNFLVEK